MEPFFQDFKLPVWISWAAPLAALGVSALLGLLVVYKRTRAGLLAIPPVPVRSLPLASPVDEPAPGNYELKSKHELKTQPTPPSVRAPVRAQQAPAPAAPIRGLTPVTTRGRGRSGMFRRSERRLALRRDSDPFPVQLSDEHIKTPSFGAHILDRSRTGLCIAVSQPIAANTILSVRSEAYGEEAVWVQVCVRHCRQREDRWLLGCAFISEQPWSVLLMFG
ncbi:hypothetical protein BH10PLA2_BH10PLA2_31290 [soil metagenome]